ncbi:G-protein alpha subunit [Mycena pura]|uniref:G-protein alpha subunit n=1 Tax=Mycena pura TaxID=153505 RepID=A0AAD6V390_9AGAR|nr:G-protein alpha subunit [Mycena pura]
MNIRVEAYANIYPSAGTRKLTWLFDRTSNQPIREQTQKALSVIPRIETTVLKPLVRRPGNNPRKTHRQPVKVIILGQPGSGKSSVLRSLYLDLAPRQFESERVVSKTAIQINIIDSIKKILAVLQDEWAAHEGSTPLTSEHQRLAFSLSLVLASETGSIQTPDSPNSGSTVRSGKGWKDKLMSFGRPTMSTSSDSEAHSPGDSGSATADPSRVAQVLAACREGIILLWEDDVVRRVLSSHGLNLQGNSCRFLDDTARIARLDYIPSDDDTMRARMRTPTPGVEEHRLVSESNPGREFLVTEIHTRIGQLSYFDDVQTIIFLAPLIFWQTLDEAPRVNRIEDTFNMWRGIVSSPLLAQTTLIVLFNKKDILQAQIAAGVLVKKYILNYGDRTNDVPSFSAINRASSTRRLLTCCDTEATDTKSTAMVLGRAMRDQIFTKYLMIRCT